MKRMMKKKWSNVDLILILGLIVALVMVFFCIHLINQQIYECVKEPLVYGVRNLQGTSNRDVACSCSAQGTQGILLVTKDGIEIISLGVKELGNYNEETSKAIKILEESVVPQTKKQ